MTTVAARSCLCYRTCSRQAACPGLSTHRHCPGHFSAAANRQWSAGKRLAQTLASCKAESGCTHTSSTYLGTLQSPKSSLYALRRSCIVSQALSMGPCSLGRLGCLAKPCSAALVRAVLCPLHAYACCRLCAVHARCTGRTCSSGSSSLLRSSSLSSRCLQAERLSLCSRLEPVQPALVQHTGT